MHTHTNINTHKVKNKVHTIFTQFGETFRIARDTVRVLSAPQYL